MTQRQLRDCLLKSVLVDAVREPVSLVTRQIGLGGLRLAPITIFLKGG